ncbi:hypothetical protein P3T76_012045 [Phytophthora citrophthora]|uniref:Vacuolar protein sorting-associated protein 13 second N-terminal domain-containing protein n=1 Tax=Phytophthora citrophthora TaxID=4793 RepID=A0AAD9G5Y8_9STRA|nr:hypothetical protein P3T76_012045 [Phytophthora citrophthora]
MIFEVLAPVLNEFFVDVQEDNVSFYAGDLFEPSHFKLTDVFLQTSVGFILQLKIFLKNKLTDVLLLQLINSLQLPFELAAGHIGNMTVEGLVGAVAGWPLEVNISDVCLVLKPNKVQWENELLIRYAKELLVAICQCLGTPSAAKKDPPSFISPAKWISSRVRAVWADMAIQLQRIHIRVESPRSESLVAYGLHIPLIRFAPRDVEEQILYRRQQPGIIYPKAADDIVSKLLTIENLSFYTDLDARTYWTAPMSTDTAQDTMEHPVAAALRTSPENDSSPHRYTVEDALKRFKECASIPFSRAELSELVFIRVIWIKLDFLKRAEQTSSGTWKPKVAAIDLVTENIELKVDFDQIAVMLEELEHVVEYFKRARSWQWRPSCINRENVSPPSVKVSASALFPLSVSDEERMSMIFSVDKQRRTRLWFRAMWRYAFRCVVDQQRRSKKEPRDEKISGTEENTKNWWQLNDIVDKELQEVRRQRYMHLYARSLSSDAMEIALYGRGKALSAAQGQGQSTSPRRRPLPVLDPLTQEDQWELSDFVSTMSVYDQRVCRALSEQELRRDFTPAPPSPTRRLSSAMGFSVDSTSDRPSHHSRSYSVDSISSSSANQAVNPAAEVAGNERHLQRGATIAFGADDLSIRHASPTSRSHSATLPSPTKRQNTLGLEPLRAWIYKQRELGIHTTSWFEKQFFPSWFWNPFQIIPLLNWQIGSVTIRLSEGNSDDIQVIKRGIGIEIGIESCSGAMLISKTPFTQILAEMRLGLLNVTLVHQSKLEKSQDTVSEYRWISSDYIRSPEDGFFYIGLKYSAQDEATKPNGRVQFAGNLDEDLGLKGRMCIGSLKIDCNEAAMRAAMGHGAADKLQTSNLDVATSTHFSILQEAYYSFVDLVAHLPKRKGLWRRSTNLFSPRAKKRPSKSNVAAPMPPDQQDLKRSAKRTQMLHALLLRSSTFEVEVGILELNLSTYTSHVENALSGQGLKQMTIKPSETREDVNVILPMTAYRLQNRPAMNECVVDVAGARVVYRSTKQGRAAVIRHLAQLFRL